MINRNRGISHDTFRILRSMVNDSVRVHCSPFEVSRDLTDSNRGVSISVFRILYALIGLDLSIRLINYGHRGLRRTPQAAIIGTGVFLHEGWLGEDGRRIYSDLFGVSRSLWMQRSPLKIFRGEFNGRVWVYCDSFEIRRTVVNGGPGIFCNLSLSKIPRDLVDSSLKTSRDACWRFRVRRFTWRVRGSHVLDRRARLSCSSHHSLSAFFPFHSSCLVFFSKQPGSLKFHLLVPGLCFGD